MSNPLYDNLLGPHRGCTRPFLHLPCDETLSYEQFLASVGQMANALATTGIVPGDRVAVQVVKSPEALALSLACIQSGLVLLPMNTAYTNNEFEYFIKDSGAKVVVVDPSNAEVANKVASKQDASVLTLGARAEGTLVDLARQAPRDATIAKRKGSDLAALLYTSGTTGRPKGAMLTHDNLLSNAQALAKEWQFVPEDVLLHALPIFHLHGLFVATNTALLSGCSMIFHNAFDVDKTIADLPRATTMMGVPTFYTRLLSDTRFDRKLVAHMRLFISGSAPMLAGTHREMLDRCGHSVLERYGMTETGMICSNPYVGERRAGTVGLPLPGVNVRIADPSTTNELPTEQVGQIEVSGPNVFAGYWGMPEKTAEEFREDNFFCTGDMGRIDQDGYVEIVGRNKDLIISGGLNVYPKEVEMVLDSHPDVLETAVVGVPDSDFGEAVVAVVVANSKVSDWSGIKSHAESKLAKFKCPKSFIQLDTLPRNAMGKVQKQLLREKCSALLAS